MSDHFHIEQGRKVENPVPVDTSLGISLLRNIQETQKVDTDLIKHYVEHMGNKYSSSLVEINFRLIDSLCSDSRYLHLSEQILFKSFQLMKAQTSKGVVYNNKQTLLDIMLETTDPHMKVAALQLLAHSEKLTQVHYIQVTEQFDSYSTFFKTNQSQTIICKVIAMLLKLSMSVKTVHKLVFLILAAQYTFKLGSPNLELISKVSKDGDKMFDKSNSIVYKYTAKHLWALYLQCQNENLQVSYLQAIVDKYAKEEINLKLGLDWKRFSTSFSKPLSTSLKLMQLDEKQNRSTSQQNLGNSCLLAKVKSIDLNQLVNFDILQDLILDAIAVNNTKALDAVTIKLKNSSLNSYNISPQFACLKLISDYFLGTKDQKRLGNFVKLFFHFGCQTLKISHIDAVIYFEQCLQVQCNISASDSIHKKLLHVSAAELDNSNPLGAAVIQLMLLNFSAFGERTIESTKCLIKRNVTSVKIIAHCLLKDSEAIDLIFQQISNETVATLLIIEIITIIEPVKQEAKKSTISQLILVAKSTIKDTGLFFYLLSRLSCIVDFPINFKTGSICFNMNSQASQFENLVLSHLYILQTFSNQEDVSEIILKSYEHLRKWIEAQQCEFDEYEMNVLKAVYYTLKYNMLYKFSLSLLESYYFKRKEQLPIEHLAFIKSQLFELKLNLHDKSGVIEMGKEMGEKYQDPENIYDMADALMRLQYLLFSDNEKAIIVAEKLIKCFEEKKTLSLQGVSNKYLIIELLFLYQKFCSVMASSQILNYSCRILNINRSISLLQYIFKSFLLNGPNTPQFNINYTAILKLRFSQSMLTEYTNILNEYTILGLGKEIDHFIQELTTFVGIQPFVNVKHYYNVELLNYNMFRSSLPDALKNYQFIQIHSKDIIDDGNELLELACVMACELYLLETEDFEDACCTSNSIDDLLNNSETEKTFVLQKWITSFVRRSSSKYIQEFTGNSNFPELADYVNFERMKTSKRNMDFVIYRPDKTMENYPAANVDENDKVMLNQLDLMTKEKMKTSLEIVQKRFGIVEKCLTNILTKKHGNHFKDFLRINLEYENLKLIPFQIEKEMALYKHSEKGILPSILSPSKNSLSLSIGDIQLSEVLPENWIAVEIDYSHSTDSLILRRHDHLHKDPLFVSIDFQDKSETSFSTMLKKLHSIIEESDRTTSIGVTSKIKTYDEKLNWWNTRKTLDKELENLLLEIEEKWFGGFISLFQHQKFNSSDLSKFTVKVINAIKNNFSKNVAEHFSQSGESLFELLLATHNTDVKRISYLLSQNLGIETVEYFSKDTLMRISKEISRYVAEVNDNVFLGSDTNNHIVLIPGKGCSQIPWESLPVLRNQSVTRMPTITQLKDFLIKYKYLLENGIDSTKGNYIINPGGDLKRTQENLEPRFSSLDGWDGIVGRAPSENEILKAFDESNLYIYAGHGGGEQYIKSKYIKSRQYIPPALLLGCSSGVIKGEGHVNPYGTAYNYINGGCPMLLVNLWDVTDKDIDIFTINMLTKWGFLVDYDSFDPFDMDAANVSLAQAVLKSRDSCKLKFLNGAAPVLYGLPLCLECI